MFLCIRYNPDRFPGAPLLGFFDGIFGTKELRKSVCTFGFEPSRDKTQRLQKLNRDLTAQGFGVVIFTETAVGVRNGNITFYVDDVPGQWGGAENNGWGSSTINWGKLKHTITVGMLNLADFLLHDVFERKGSVPGSKIFAKMDIEGLEYEVIPEVIMRNALCQIDALATEIHPFKYPRSSPLWMSRSNFISKIKSSIKSVPNCKTSLTDIDDESYRLFDDDIKNSSHSIDFGSDDNKALLFQARELLSSGQCKHIYLDIGTNIGVQIRKL